MDALEKETEQTSSDASRFPALDDPFQDPADDSISEPKEQANGDASARPRKRALRRTAQSTKSSLRRRTISNPITMRPRRKLKFADSEQPPRHEQESRSDRRERHDPLREQLEHHFPAKLNFKQRMRHFTWTWFTMTMATGGIANVLYSIPDNLRFDSLYALGCTFFLFNIVLFIFNVTMISIRFYNYPETFRQSFTHPTESLFVPAAIISLGTIVLNITQYGVDYTGDWLTHTIVPLFWLYCALAVLFSWGIFLTIWSTQTFTIAKMTPVWIFPAYPLLICGPHAANISKKLMPEQALPVIIGGFILQGTGFMLSLMVYSAFLYRLMTQKLPKESLRPAMFISVGPSGFTITAFIQMGQELPRVVHKDFMGEGMGEFVGRVSMVLANWAGMWLWGLAIWLFLVSVGAHYSCATRGKLDFAMTWYSFVFPNTALTTSTFAISNALHGNVTEARHFSRGTRPFQILGCIMTVALVSLWFFVFGMMIRAVIMKQILWPQKQEDRDEGGWGKDERLRKGEIQSFMHSRQASHVALDSMRGPRQVVARPSGEATNSGVVLDEGELARAAAKYAQQRVPSISDLDNEQAEKAEANAAHEDDDGIYMTTTRESRKNDVARTKNGTEEV